MCTYQIADKLPKGEFKKLTCSVIDFDKGKSLSSINAMPLSLLSLAAWKEIYLNWYKPT